MNTRRGFSLIELALVLGISGLMVGFVLQSQQSAATADCYVSTRMQLADINGAIQRFARVNERLPMPANRSVGVEGPTYGREASGAAIDTVGTTSWGALPFQALGLAPSYASDCWGNKFTYVVTTALTTNAASGGYLDSNVAGSITLKKDASTNLNTTTAYAVISHGQDALGAVKANYNGSSHGWCSGASLKYYNCLPDPSSVKIADAPFNNGKDAGANYFDDLIVASGRPQLLNNTNLYCWGTDVSGTGILADYNFTANHYSYTPKQAQGNISFASLSDSSSATPCGLTGDGTAYCWGDNNWGQIGDGTTTKRAVPTKVNTTVKFKKLKMITATTRCGFAKDDRVYCWGWSGYGMLALNNLSIPTPTLIDASLTFKDISYQAYGHGICGLTTGGDVYCRSDSQQNYGAGPTNYIPNSASFTMVGGGHKFDAFFAGEPGKDGICAITSAADPGGAGKIYCWGHIAYFGALGLAPPLITNISQSTTATITYTPGTFNLSAGDRVYLQNVQGMEAMNFKYFYVVNGHFTANSFEPSTTDTSFTPVNTSAYAAYTSGGQLVMVARNVPTLIDNVGGITFSKLLSGTSALSTTGQVYSWGGNGVYSLGDGSTAGRLAIKAHTTLSNSNPAVVTTSTAHGYNPGDLIELIISSPNAQGGSAGTITLDASESAVNGFYTGQRLIITSGAGLGNVRTGGAYDGTSKILESSSPWSATPDATSRYLIGTPKQAQAGSSTTITLHASDAQADGYYVGQTIGIVAGAGNSSSRVVTAYNGATNIATVSPSWTSPNATSSYLIGTPKAPQGGSSVNTIKLDAASSAVNGFYVGQTISCQSLNRTITAYDGTTKVATIAGAWTNAPTTDQYVIGGSLSTRIFKVGAVTATTFQLYNSDGTPLDTTYTNTYPSGGSSYKLPQDGSCYTAFSTADGCSFTPVPLFQSYGGVPFTVIDADKSQYSYTAIGANGTYYGWGPGWNGGCGDNTASGRPTPVPIVNGGVTLVTPFYHGSNNVPCMMSDVGDTYCWSANSSAPYGVFGDGTTTNKLKPSLVAGGMKFRDLAFANIANNNSVNSVMCGIKDDPNLNCAAQTVNWGAGCTGNIPASNNGDASSVSNTAVGFTGNVTATCVEGTIQQSNATCM